MINIKLSRVLGDKRLTQAELSRKTGIRPMAINEMYNDIAERVNLDYLDKICEVLECDISDILVYTPNNRPRTGAYLIYEEHGNRKR